MKRLICTMLFAFVSLTTSHQPAFGEPMIRQPAAWNQSLERSYCGWDYDGDRILGRVGPMVYLWDAKSGKLLHKMEGHQEGVCCVAICPDGIHALSSSWREPDELQIKSKDTRTIVWSLKTGEKLVELPGQVAGEFSPDGKRIVTFSARNGTLTSFDATVWDVATGREAAKTTLDDYRSPHQDTLHFSPDGNNFASVKAGVFRTCNSSGVVLYDTKTGKEIGRAKHMQGSGHRFTSNRTLASFGLLKENIVVFDVKSGREMASFPHGIDTTLWGQAWTHDGKRVAAIPLPKKGAKLTVFEVADSLKSTLGDEIHPAIPRAAIVSPDNSSIAIESGVNPEDDSEVRLYAMNSGKELARIPLAKIGQPRHHRTQLIGFSPDSKTLLVGGSEFIIYNAEDGKEVRRLKLLDDVSMPKDLKR